MCFKVLIVLFSILGVVPANGNQHMHMQEATNCKIDVTISQRNKKKTKRAMFLIQYFCPRRQKKVRKKNICMVRLEFQCIETEISARRDCSLSIVGLESHFTKMIWYWNMVCLWKAHILHTLPHINQRVAPYGATLQLLLCVTKIT